MADQKPRRPLGVLLARPAWQSPTSSGGRVGPVPAQRTPAQRGDDRSLVVAGYRPGDDLTPILEGCTALLEGRALSGTPVHLHLPGTLVEAAAWHEPGFVDLVRRLLDRGLVRMVGGTYAEDGLTAFAPGLHRRQLVELFGVYQRHLGVPPGMLRTAWVPTRTRDADRFWPVLADATLPNRGYRHVVLHDDPDRHGRHPVDRAVQVLRLARHPRRPRSGPGTDRRVADRQADAPAAGSSTRREAVSRATAADELGSAAAPVGGGPLVDLAWRHLLGAPAGCPASSRILLAAARWFGARHDRACASVVDLDGDGRPELVLANDGLFAVLDPALGGRLVHLATRTDDGGALVVGDLHGSHLRRRPQRTAGRPAHRRGAFCDVGACDDVHTVTVDERDSVVCADLVNDQVGSGLRGTRKRVTLGPGDLSLAADYEVPGAGLPLDVLLCLSPDHLGLLDHGREGLTLSEGGSWCAARRGAVSVWTAVSAGTTVGWREDTTVPVGHGVVVGVHAAQPRFRIRVGIGQPAGATYGHLRADKAAVRAMVDPLPGMAER